MGIMARKGLIKFIIAREGPAQNLIFISMLLHEAEWGRGEAYKKRGLKMS